MHWTARRQVVALRLTIRWRRRPLDSGSSPAPTKHAGTRARAKPVPPAITEDSTVHRSLAVGLATELVSEATRAGDRAERSMTEIPESVRTAWADHRPATTGHCSPATAHRSPVYVDRLRVQRSRIEPARTAGEQFGHRWCHLWSDDLDALHAMAAALGIHRKWFQDRPGFPHYDLPPVRREKALALGAVEHSLKAWLREKKPRSEPGLGGHFLLSALGSPVGGGA